MKVTLDIPDELFWAVAARAETFDQRVDEYAVDLLVTSVATANPVENDPLLRLWRAGYSDAEIGFRLNQTNATVAARRRRFGLPANRKRRGDVPLSVARTSQFTPESEEQAA